MSARACVRACVQCVRIGLDVRMYVNMFACTRASVFLPVCMSTLECLDLPAFSFSVPSYEETQRGVFLSPLYSNCLPEDGYNTVPGDPQDAWYHQHCNNVTTYPLQPTTNVAQPVRFVCNGTWRERFWLAQSFCRTSFLVLLLLPFFFLSR